MGRKAGPRKAPRRRRAANPGLRRQVAAGSRRYRDFAERLFSNSALVEGVGLFINGKWSPCWLWLGPKNTSGYGLISKWDKNRGKNRQRLAHHVSKEELTGEKLLGEVQRHLCDNRTCINPEHTVHGTQYENYLDSMRSGKHINARGRVPGEDDE